MRIQCRADQIGMAEGKGGDCKRDTALKLPRSFGRQASAALNGEHHYLVF